MLTELELRDYLTRDPLKLGLAGMFALDDDTAVADVLNDPIRGALIPIERVPRAEVIDSILSDPANVAKYAPFIPFLQMAETVPAALIANDFPALRERQGSPVEVAFGEGVTVSPGEVSASVPDVVRADREARAAAAAERFKAETIAELIAVAQDKLTETVSCGGILEGIADGYGGMRFIPAADPFSTAIREECHRGQPSEKRLAELSYTEMMRIGGGV